MDLYQRKVTEKLTGLFLWKYAAKLFYKLRQGQPIDATKTDRVTSNGLTVSVRLSSSCTHSCVNEPK